MGSQLLTYLFQTQGIAEAVLLIFGAPCARLEHAAQELIALVLHDDGGDQDLGAPAKWTERITRPYVF